jgi:hypothetical protein
MRAEMRTKATPQESRTPWADPEKIAHWFPGRADGKAEPDATSPGSSTNLTTVFPASSDRPAR